MNMQNEDYKNERNHFLVGLYSRVVNNHITAFCDEEIKSSYKIVSKIKKEAKHGVKRAIAPSSMFLGS